MKTWEPRIPRTIELLPGQDFHVLRGALYENHNASTCYQCQTHPHAYDGEWPKIHEINGVLYGPPFEIYLKATPTIYFPEGYDYPARKRNDVMGNFIDDIFRFIYNVIKSILDWVWDLLKRIWHDLTHPKDLLKDLVQGFFDLITFKFVLDFLRTFPLTHWLYAATNWLLGGFLDNLTTLLSLPGKFFSGQKITRQEVVKALGALVQVISFAIVALTGGIVVASLLTSINLLKQGPLGKIPGVDILLDIAAIAGGAYVMDEDIIDAFVKAGLSALKKVGLGGLADALHINKLAVSLTEGGTESVTGVNVVDTTSDVINPQDEEFPDSSEFDTPSVEEPETPEPEMELPAESPTEPEMPEEPIEPEMPEEPIEPETPEEPTEPETPEEPAEPETPEEPTEPETPEEPEEPDNSDLISALELAKAAAELALPGSSSKKPKTVATKKPKTATTTVATTKPKKVSSIISSFFNNSTQGDGSAQPNVVKAGVGLGIGLIFLLSVLREGKHHENKR